MLLLGAEVVNLLVELLVGLQVGLELVDRLLRYLVELVLLALYWRCLLYLAQGLLLARRARVLLLDVHLVVVYFLTQQLAGDFLLLLF